MLTAPDLTIIPSRQRDYFHCCAFPIAGPAAWPRCFSVGAQPPILIEYDLEGDGPEMQGWRTLEAQRSPADVRENLRLSGAEASVDSHGVPIACSQHLVTRLSLYVHHLTAALPANGFRSDVVWHSAAETLRRTLVPETWEMLDGCAAIFHYMDAEFAYFLSPDRGWWRQWLEDLIDARFALAALSPAAPSVIASWVAESLEGTGGRLSSIQFTDDGAGVRVRGFYGCDPRSPIQLGIRGSKPFDVEIPLPEPIAH